MRTQKQPPKTKKAHRKPTRKQKVLYGILLVFLALLLWIIGSVIYEINTNGEYYAFRYSGTEQRFEPLSITFAPEDFEEDIFANEGYLAKNRQIRYITGTQSTDIELDEDASYYGSEFVFLKQYLQALVNGDYESYVTFFVPEYGEDPGNLPIPKDAFTKQKLYDITIEYRQGDTVQVSKEETKQYFIVKYAIYQNNGSFRPDIRSDTVLPLLFEIITNGEEIKISKIIKYIG